MKELKPWVVGRIKVTSYSPTGVTPRNVGPNVACRPTRQPTVLALSKWWRLWKSHPPDVLIANEVTTLGSPNPQSGGSDRTCPGNPLLAKQVLF